MPEITIFLLGVLLRLSMVWNYHAAWNYDSEAHWEVIQWIVENRSVPAIESTFEAYHPPLYYLIAARLVLLGVTRESLVWFSVGCGIVTLGLIWLGLELYVRHSRWTRVAALSLASVTCAMIHIDGMIYAEALSGCLCAGIMVLLPAAFRRSGLSRWVRALTIGLILGLAMLTKISALVIVGAIGTAAAIEFVALRRTLSSRLTNGLAWGGMLAVTIGISAWYFQPNARQYGSPLITSFMLPADRWRVAEAMKKPMLDRRPIGYLLGWDTDVYRYPFFPSGAARTPRFLPVAIASTVVDYWSIYGFAGYGDLIPGTDIRGMKPSSAVLTEAQLAMFGGTVIFIAAVAAWIAVMKQSLRRRDVGRVALLLIPLFAVLAAVSFSISYPLDMVGVTKGAYLMFAAPPLFALFGTAVAWAQRVPTRWPLFVALGVSLALVGWYSIVCRFDLPAMGHL